MVHLTSLDPVRAGASSGNLAFSLWCTAKVDLTTLSASVAFLSFWLPCTFLRDLGFKFIFTDNYVCLLLLMSSIKCLRK